MALVRADDAVLLLIDMQERLQRTIHDDATLRRKAAALAEGFRLLDVPLVVTEQYPKGLGPTVPELAGALAAAGGAVAKTAFSCPADANVSARLDATGRQDVFLAGVEAHVCVMQTALDLLAEGRRVHVVLDAVGSRDPANKQAGIERMLRAGAQPSTVEMALFELMGDARHPRFRDVQALVK